eukprot:TRINITY_DN5721_c0_g1_i2.p1 TRINITY_DN5721_c0_g1~~TRINITY_DN5721_c0_g1_i2.p1  ORF type:complete len:360 (-),score=89.55 TRINITY_DN5721_c0_g1_i2:171-1250(-)
MAATPSIFSPRRSASPQKPKTPLVNLRENLFRKVLGSQPGKEHTRKGVKVTVVGVGNVGMACAQTILTEDICDELVLIDVIADKLKGEMLDLQHAAAFLPRTIIKADTDYAASKDSDICVVTAGARQRDGESRLSLVGRNVSLLKLIIPKLVEHSPDCILLLISNPVDILTYAAWKISGLPSNRVIGSGTNLDSSRFRFLLADSLNVNAHNVHGYIIGEHGDSSVPVWSSVSISGVPLFGFLNTIGVEVDTEQLDGIHKQVVQGAYDVIKLKGYTNWAIGYSVASLVTSIVRDQRRIHPVSVLAQGFHGIEQGVFLSLPCLLGREGNINVIEQTLEEEEVEKLKTSASTLWKIQEELGL